MPFDIIMDDETERSADMTISEKIFELIKERGMTQKEFSEATGIAQSTISDWKRKKTNPASDKIMIICDVLGVDPIELLSGTEGENFKQPEYLQIDKNSAEYEIVESYRNMDPRTQARIKGYIDALRGDI